jgi:tungstate transport system substrate-binding protein
MNTRRFAAALAAALLLARCGREAKGITLVTTPEVAGNGVAAMLAERFTRESQVPVAVLVTEERFVAPMIDKELADVVITTSPPLQDALQKSGHARLTSTFAFNDFLLVGPKRDPADVQAAHTAAEALRQIARTDRPFCSPIDVPELREREAALWTSSDAQPDDDRRYRRCHGSAEDVLREADHRDAYTITDRATFERTRRLDLVPLLQRTPMLRNGYTITLLERGRRHRRNSEWFVQWVMSFRGREAIESERRLFVSER